MVIISNWEDFTYGVPQGSILRPILCNIYLCDLFYEYENYFAHHADDTTSYTVGDKTTEVSGPILDIYWVQLLHPI